MKKKKLRKKNKLCDMYIDEKSQVQKNKKKHGKKQQHSNQFIKSKKKKINKINKLKAQLHHLNNQSFNITHLDLAT